MRGEKEQYCLDIVKNHVFTKNGTPCCNPLTGKNFSEVTDEEFKKGQVWYINSDYYNSCFGLLKKDRTELENILRIAKPNPSKSVFPDFIFPNGFIEHFQVTSSRDNRKGSEHIKQMNQFRANVEKQTEQIRQEWDKIPSFDQIRSKSWAIPNPQHSHDFLIHSFQKNWEHHLNSLSSYTGDTDIGIFLIEYSDFALSMIENVYAGWIDGMSQGDMREQEKFKCYRLTRDKKMLEYIYQFRNQIQYVIFVYCQGIEIIKTENIPYLLKLMPWEYVIYPMCVTTVSSLYNISVPADFSEEDECSNDKT